MIHEVDTRAGTFTISLPATFPEGCSLTISVLKRDGTWGETKTYPARKRSLADLFEWKGPRLP